MKAPLGHPLHLAMGSAFKEGAAGAAAAGAGFDTSCETESGP